MKLKPIFVESLPPFESIKEGELWISHKFRAINLRCPCGCGKLTPLTIAPTKWHVHFDGESVSLKGPTGGSIWTTLECGSHYFITNNEVQWSYPIDQSRRGEYEEVERERIIRRTRTNEATSAPKPEQRNFVRPIKWLLRLAHIGNHKECPLRISPAGPFASGAYSAQQRKPSPKRPVFAAVQCKYG